MIPKNGEFSPSIWPSLRAVARRGRMERDLPPENSPRYIIPLFARNCNRMDENHIKFRRNIDKREAKCYNNGIRNAHSTKYRIKSDVRGGRISASVSLAPRRELPELKLRLRHPSGAKIVSASVNGSPAAVAPDGETVVVKAPPAVLEITAEY